MQKVLKISYDELPPTTNHIYSTNRYGKRFLTKEAKKYKTKFISFVAQNHFGEIASLNPNGIYRVKWAFYFPKNAVINLTFGKKGGAKSRYKKMDITNRTKLIEDALVTALGIDDRQIFETVQKKLIGDGHVEIEIEEMDPKLLGIGA